MQCPFCLLTLELLPNCCTRPDASSAGRIFADLCRRTSLSREAPAAQTAPSSRCVRLNRHYIPNPQLAESGVILTLASVPGQANRDARMPSVWQHGRHRMLMTLGVCRAPEFPEVTATQSASGRQRSRDTPTRPSCTLKSCSTRCTSNVSRLCCT